MHLRTWLAARALSQSELARLAGLHRSVINRFMEKEQSLNPLSAVRLYGVLKLSLNPLERQHWIEWLGLEGVSSLLDGAPDIDKTYSIAESYPNLELGLQWFRLATNTLAQSITESIRLFEQAERSFGPYSNMAALSGCEIIANLINLGDLPRAEQEVFRVDQTYRDVMDVETRSRFLNLRAIAAYDGRDFARAQSIACECLAFGKAHHYETQAEHMLALVQLGIAERLPDGDPKRLQLLAQAEHNMRLMCRHYEKEGHPVRVGFQYFRLAQILREQGLHDDAKAARSLAWHLFQQDVQPHGARNHVRLEEANLALLDGETDLARVKANTAFDGWVFGNYAGGIARSSGAVALSLRIAGKFEEAWEPALVAASLAPYEWCVKGDRFTELLGEISQSVRQKLGVRKHQMMIEGLRERIAERHGYFAGLYQAMPGRSAEALALLQAATSQG